MSNFDFGGFINEENPYVNENDEEGFEEYLTVKALLCLKFGDHRGSAIYRMLSKYAKRATKGMSGEPGILFDGEGGEFVSFNDNARTAEDE